MIFREIRPRARVLSAAAVLVAGLSVGLSSPVEAAVGDGSGVTLTSVPGDGISFAGGVFDFQVPAAEMGAVVSDDRNDLNGGVSLFDANGFFSNLTWDLRAPQGTALSAGLSFPLSPVQPSATEGQLFLGGSVVDSGFCIPSGQVTVHSATFGPHGWIQDFDATFTAGCGPDPTVTASGRIVVHNPPPPPELVITVTVDPTARVSKISGAVTLTGTLTCSRDATVNAFGSVSQKKTRNALANGFWQINDVPCSSVPVRWSAEALPEGTVPFGVGKAGVAAQSAAFDPLFGIPAGSPFDAAVSLKF